MISILLDTDVCLDSLAGRSPWNADADYIFHASVENRCRIYVSGLTFANLFYLLRKQHGSETTQHHLGAMRDLVQISPMNHTVVDQALEAEWNDFEDALQYYSALESGCQMVISRNISDYSKAGQIEVKTPADFILTHLS